MKELACRNCGANALKRVNGYFFCPYCESRYLITKEDMQGGFLGDNHQSALSHCGVKSVIALDEDVARLLKKCETDPRNAKKYANLILDIDPDNKEAMQYLKL